MKYVPWILLAIVSIVLGLRSCDGPADHSVPKHKYDSATFAGSKLAIRANVLESELTTMKSDFRTLQSEAHEESDSLKTEVSKARRHPKVVEIVKEVPAVAEAFGADDKMIFHQHARILELEKEYQTYTEKDSLFHLTLDSIKSNLDFRNKVLAQNITGLEKDLKKQSNPFSIGFSAGPGIVIGPDGQVHGGLAVSVGVNLKIRRRR